MTEQTPRITAKYLEQFQNNTVRMIGKVVAVRGEQATIDADGQVNVILNREAHVSTNSAVEIIGKVTNDLSIRAFTSTDFGTNIDYEAVKNVVDATHRYKEIFY